MGGDSQPAPASGVVVRLSDKLQQFLRHILFYLQFIGLARIGTTITRRYKYYSSVLELAANCRFSSSNSSCLSSLCCDFSPEALPRLEMRIQRSLDVVKMGVVNYLDALKLQQMLVSDRRLGRIPDTLLSLQHPHTYTLGKRKTYHNLLVPEDDLRSMGAELHYTQRGGDITYHGPHQAILYPIISLRGIGLGARKYVENLEQVMIELASLYGVKARPGNKCETGVWVENRKIGAIGVQISSGFTSHGLAFNIDPDMNYFEHIVPCGIADKEVTSLKMETEKVLPTDEMIHEQLVSCFARTFCYDTIVQKESASVLSELEESDKNLS